MQTRHFNFFSSDPNSLQMRTLAQQIADTPLPNGNRAEIHFLPLSAMAIAPAEFEQHAFATGADPAVQQEGGRRK